MRKLFIPASCALLLLLASLRLETEAVEGSTYVKVSAGIYDRHDVVVSFMLPGSLRKSARSLRDGSGHVIPLQVDSNGRACFVLGQLKAGATRKYRVETSKPRPGFDKGVEVVRAGEKLTVQSGGRPLIGFQAQGELPRQDIKPIFRRGGYIHPVYTPSGRVVSDDYPADHLHHHGVWFAWTKTEFEGRHPDFWNMGDGTGTVEFVSVDETFNGPVHSLLKSKNRYVDLSSGASRTVLDETWEVTVYRPTEGSRPYNVFDLVSTQECATSSPLVLPEYHYGGVGFRGRHEWLGSANAFFLTSEGKDRSNGHATRARWCHVGGMVDGKLAGIGILCHPENFRAPQPMRIHPNEPFFCYAPSQLGRWEIAPEQKYVSRYRFVVFDGPPDAAELNRLWNDYASPPQITIERVEKRIN